MKSISTPNYGWVIVIGAFLSWVCFGFSRNLYAYVLPNMQTELNLSHQSMGNIASSYFLAYTAMTFIWGIIADRVGPRKCILIGLVTTSIGLSGMGFTPSLIVGCLSYLLCGAGAAGISIPIVTFTSRWFRGKRRGAAFGLTTSGTSVLTVVAGLVIPIILVALSWRWVWWLSAASVLVITIICWLLLTDAPAERGPGTAGSNGKSLLTSREQGKDDSSNQTKSWETIKYVMKRGITWNLAIIYFAHGISYVSFMTFGVAYLEEMGWEAKAAAGVFALWGALGILGHILSGIAADRWPKKYLFAIAMSLESISMFVFLSGTTAAGYVGGAIAGLAITSIPTIMQISMADYCEPAIIGTTMGFVALVFGVAAIIAPTVGGALADISGTLSSAIIFGLGSAIMGFAFALMLRKPPKQTA